MPRSVYFDPFGSYLGGYRLGVNDEMSLQKNTREARDSDLANYNAQRETALQDYADPYRRQAIPLGLENAQLQTFQNRLSAAEIPATTLGIANPYVDAILRQFNIQAQPVGESPQLQTARQHYNTNLDATLNAGGIADSPELRNSVAQQIAQYYNVPVEQLLSPGMAAPQGTDYYMNGQRVGGMVDPYTQVINQLLRPQVLREAVQRNSIEQQRYNQAQQDAARQANQEWLDFARSGYGRNSGAVQPAVEYDGSPFF